MDGNVEMICIGDELLDGRIRDRNAALLGGILDERGATLRSVAIVPDDVAAIQTALDRAKAAIVVVSGGLGPTDDDVTRQAAANWFDAELAVDDESLDWLIARYAARNRPFTDNNRRQAEFPVGATILATEVGTAPGFQLDDDEQRVFFLPGVPREFAWFVERYVVPALGRAIDETASRALHFHGIAEAALENRLLEVSAAARAKTVKLGFRADYPVIEVKVSGRPDDVAEIADRIELEAGSWLVGSADQPLPARLGERLLERGATIATAESCTAGGIGALITEVSGSSGWFGQGFITYSNAAKTELLGVREEVLIRWGAVSPQTVVQMAAGARDRSRSTFAVAVSGIAGPGGGTPEKPVGTVHFGLATPSGTYHRHVHFRVPNRALVRAGTAYTALAMALWYLEDRIDDHRVAGPFSDDDVWSTAGIELEDH